MTAGPHLTDGPAAMLFEGVVGQQRAVELLRASLRRPVHAYLLLGPPGAGGRRLATAVAASVLCERGGCGTCATCRRVLDRVHPDVVEVERHGASLAVSDVRSGMAQAQRRPLEGARQVIIISDLHLGRSSAPALLKTLEEPPGPTVFVLLADSLVPELITVASRCLVVRLRRVPDAELAAWLTAQGVERDAAAVLAESSGGDVERAGILARDPDAGARAERWRSVPGRLDGTGAVAASLADELAGSLDASLAPLREQHRAALDRLAEEEERSGRGGARRQLEESHVRAERRFRSDELRAGLGLLARRYHELLVADPGHLEPARGAALLAAIASVEATAQELVRNPNELLLLQALFVRLSAVGAASPGSV